MSLVYAGICSISSPTMHHTFQSGAVLNRSSALATIYHRLTLLALFMPLLATAQQVPQLDLQRTKLSAGMHLIDAQVARTPEQRQIGLMMRKEMPQQEGMIFVFEQASQQCFWMKNTLLPLTAAFVADDGRIVNMADMKPQTEEAHCSGEPVRYVLEMNKGWFAKKGIKPGDKLSGSFFQSAR